VHELLESNKANHIDTVVFNGLVDTTDPGSGTQFFNLVFAVLGTDLGTERGEVRANKCDVVKQAGRLIAH
jgi:hypothetical protein